MIQFPFSIFDQRLVKILPYLKSEGITLLGRSIFLQGLLLKDSKYWPDFINSKFVAHHKNFKEYLEKEKISLLEASLGFASKQKLLDFILIGVTNIRELQEINRIWNKVNTNKNHFFNNLDNWSWQNKADLDPRLWPN